MYYIINYIVALIFVCSLATYLGLSFGHDTLIIIVVLSVFILVVIICYIDASFIHANDYFRIGALIIAVLHFNDTLTDILFTVNITLQSEYPSEPLPILFALSVIFIVIPAITTIYQLHTAVNEWGRSDDLSVWLADNIKTLYGCAQQKHILFL